MKSISLKYIGLFIGLIAVSFIFNSCEKEDDWGKDFEQNDQAPKIAKVFLEDANSSVTDRAVEFARWTDHSSRRRKLARSNKDIYQWIFVLLQSGIVEQYFNDRTNRPECTDD
ncbi:hypothetical protein FACS1894145_6330 [Bacteroidia bacterium]|nr:hypothetical protein FACS1894145_6330 [Bacteroidia bacterium]